MVDDNIVGCPNVEETMFERQGVPSGGVGGAIFNVFTKSLVCRSKCLSIGEIAPKFFSIFVFIGNFFY